MTHKTTFKDYAMLGLVALTMATYHTLEAKTVVQLHTVSYHEDRDSHFNEENLGLGARHYVTDELFDYVSFGYYKNSEYRTSYYAAIGHQWDYGDFNIKLNTGIVTGYDEYKVAPFVIPSLGYKGFTLSVVPYHKKVIHLTLDLIKF